MPKFSYKLRCKPKTLHVGPLDSNLNEEEILLHEELEAMYLTDVKNLYHEECAKIMGISRPTFSKYLKNGRRKCANLFLQQKSLKIKPKSQTSYIVFPSEDKKSLSSRFNSAKFFVIVSKNKKETLIDEIIENPIYKHLISLGKVPNSDEMTKGLGAGRVIPPLFSKATMVYALKIGEGMKRNLENLGIEIKIIDEQYSGVEILSLVKEV